MAYMNQQRKREKQDAVKAVLKKYSLKGSLSVRNRSTLVLTVFSGKLDFINNFKEVAGPQLRNFDMEMQRSYLQVNEYHLDSQFNGECLLFLQEVKKIMMAGNWDRSDIMTDYFNVGWYIDINIGRWDKPYLKN